MFKTKSLAVFLLLLPFLSSQIKGNDSTSSFLSICPKVHEQDLKQLAKEGHTTLEGQHFKLASFEETKNNYNGRLIENKENLEHFLTQSSALVTVTRLVNSHENQHKKSLHRTHCPYNLERASDVVVIALVPSS